MLICAFSSYALEIVYIQTLLLFDLLRWALIEGEHLMSWGLETKKIIILRLFTFVTILILDL